VGGKADQGDKRELGSSEIGVHPDLDPLSLPLFSCFHPHSCYSPFPAHSLLWTADVSEREARPTAKSRHMAAVIRRSDSL
jgi:hypothetical protein